MVPSVQPNDQEKANHQRVKRKGKKSLEEKEFRRKREKKKENRRTDYSAQRATFKQKASIPFPQK